MKVLMYGWEFPPRISGGLGVACYAIVKELAKKRVDLTLVLPETVDPQPVDNVTLVKGGNLASFDQELGSTVTIKYPKIATYLSPYIRSSNFKSQLSNETLQEFLAWLAKIQLPAALKVMIEEMVFEQMAGSKVTDRYETNLLTEVLRYALFAGSLAKEVDHEVIHAHDWLTILAALQAKRHSHKPVVLHIHALETDRSGLRVDKRIYAIEKYGMEQADQIIAVSQYTKDQIIQHYGIEPEKITVVHNGIYCDEEKENQVRQQKSHNMVLFLGRITQQKGPYFFIETARRVLAKKPDVQFVLAGTGDLLIDMIEHAAALRIGKNVHFTGFLEGDQVREIYRLADVYVMPSVSEPFGLSALEALSYNVPTIISKQSGVAEVLHSTLVVDFWDIEEMAAKILALLDYQSLGETTLVYTRDDLQATTWERAAEKIINLYNYMV